MDSEQARDSLDEVDARERQVLEREGAAGLPWWYIAGMAVVLFAGGASGDLDSGWQSTYVPLIGGVLVISALAFAVRRSAGVRPHPSRHRRARTRVLVGTVVAVLVTNIAVGTVLRLYDVELDATIAAAPATVLFVAGTYWLRKVLLAGGQRVPA